MKKKLFLSIFYLGTIINAQNIVLINDGHDALIRIRTTDTIGTISVIQPAKILSSAVFSWPEYNGEIFRLPAKCAITIPAHLPREEFRLRIWDAEGSYEPTPDVDDFGRPVKTSQENVKYSTALLLNNHYLEHARKKNMYIIYKPSVFSSKAFTITADINDTPKWYQTGIFSNTPVDLTAYHDLHSLN